MMERSWIILDHWMGWSPFWNLWDLSTCLADATDACRKRTVVLVLLEKKGGGAISDQRCTLDHWVSCEDLWRGKLAPGPGFFFAKGQGYWVHLAVQHVSPGEPHANTSYLQAKPLEPSWVKFGFQLISCVNHVVTGICPSHCSLGQCHEHCFGDWSLVLASFAWQWFWSSKHKAAFVPTSWQHFELWTPDVVMNDEHMCGAFQWILWVKSWDPSMWPVSLPVPNFDTWNRSVPCHGCRALRWFLRLGTCFEIL